MKCHICLNWSFLLAVSLLAYGLARMADSEYEYSKEPNKIFQKNLDCISRSENQDLCNEYTSNCTLKLPLRVMYNHYSCMVEVVGIEYDQRDCTDDELYFSEDSRRKINNCTYLRVGKLGDDEREQLDSVYNCTEDIAKELGCAYDDSSSKEED